MSTRRDGELLRLEGAVTMDTVAGMLDEARAACREGAVRVDFSSVSEVDSAAIALALELKRDAAERQGSLAFDNLPASLLKLIDLYGIGDHLGA